MRKASDGKKGLTIGGVGREVVEKRERGSVTRISLLSPAVGGVQSTDTGGNADGADGAGAAAAAAAATCSPSVTGVPFV